MPSDAIRTVIATDPLKHMVIARLIAGAPLAVFGVMHLVSEEAAMRPILEAANIPLPGLNAALAPIVEIVAGLLMLTGLLTRLGAFLGAITMIVAIYAHVVADWPNEPPMVIAIIVLAASLYLLWRGVGAWSVDRSRSSGPAPSSAE